MFKLQRILLGLAASLVGFGPALVAAAQKLPPEVLMRMPPEQQKAYVKAQIAKQQQLRSRPGPSAPLDVTPPVLTYINAGSTLNLRLAQPPFNVVVKATDDLSGVSNVQFNAYGPSGQSIYGYLEGGYPAKVLNGKGAFYLDNRLLEPGVWTIDYAYLYDTAGNYTFYDGAQLAALGNTTFTVKSAAYDLVPPTLVSGTILSPSVSLSSFAKGTADVPPYIGVRVDATDTGNTGLAGVRSAQLTFCLADLSRCIYVYSYSYVGGLPATTLSLRGNVSADYGDLPGDYFIYHAYVQDGAGNSQYLYSTLFGGTTDFSVLFPTTMITLTP